ncbi:MAG: rhodanese-like domain-containing protein [Thermodesulfobacteriota bacterium]
MKRQFVLLIVTACLLAAGPAGALTDEESKVIQKVAHEYLSNIPEDGYAVQAADVMEMIKSGKKDFVIVDLRMPKDKKYDKGHVPRAMYIGFRELAKPENLAKLPKDKDIIIYCDTGHEQNKAVSVLRMLGFNARQMKWGFMSWSPLRPTALTLEAIVGSMKNEFPLEK